MTIAITERQIMTEFLELYRDFPCLWYTSHTLYTNREAREQAYEVLLEKYKTLQEDANVDTVRKKIDNMRCAYKRERKRVLTSLARGTEEHKPTLWYYKLLSFIDGANDDVLIDNSLQLEVQDDYEFDEECQESPKRKKVKKEVSSVFIPELHEVDGTVSQSQRYPLQGYSDVSEAESFGRTVGFQLRELEPMQRFIAEKLISDVIFYGRLDKLNMQTNVSLNHDYQ